MSSHSEQVATLRRIAHRAMVDRGLEPDFSPAAMEELAQLAPPSPDGARADLRSLPWCSIDNDDSEDIDQLSVAVERDGKARILVAIADVDGLVSLGTAIDRHAERNTTSVYTPGTIFPMLPERLSTDLTSLAADQDRPAMVIEMEVAEDGTLGATGISFALVRNRAKLAYDNVAAWLDGHAQLPGHAGQVPGLEDSLRRQRHLASALNGRRHEHGALDLETPQSRAVFDAQGIRDLVPDRKNPAKQLIEDLMIAANGVVARFLDGKKSPSLRRVVRAPKRWDRIVTVAAEHGAHLPDQPDSRALSAFLVKQRAADPVRFPDLSLTVVKLLGAGEYAVDLPGQAAPGHFGLAVRDYAHSTAPNRRFPDLITQRLVKAAIAGTPPPYSVDELGRLAQHCTLQEDAANKVERQVEKSAAALLLAGRIGERFDAIVTGASQKGTWVRVFAPPVEGRLAPGDIGLDVGTRVRVRLASTDVERGFIDFDRAD